MYCPVPSYTSRPFRFQIILGGGIALTGHFKSILLPSRTYTLPPTSTFVKDFVETRFCVIANTLMLVGAEIKENTAMNLDLPLLGF